MDAHHQQSLLPCGSTSDCGARISTAESITVPCSPAMDGTALLLLSRFVPCAVGFLSRPAGAVLFGHLGDTKGRGFCLLLSVLVMGVPTVLIGCLPTYDQAGYASPVLLAVLRLVQGRPCSRQAEEYSAVCVVSQTACWASSMQM